MNFVYCDASLINARAGHYVSICRAVANEVKSRGINTLILAHQQIESELAKELGATPFFACNPNQRFSEDPLCGWLLDFHHNSQSMTQDLARINGLGSTDILWYDTSLQAQFMALITWAQTTFTPSTCPHIFVAFNEYPGVVPTRNSDGDGEVISWEVRHLPSILYRFASTQLQDAFREKFHLITGDFSHALAYKYLIGRPVLEAPHFFKTKKNCDLRKIQPSMTIGFLGVQRPHHGFQYVPEIVKNILAFNNSAKVIVHDSGGRMPQVVNEIRFLSHNEPRLELITSGMEGESEWNALLERCDLLVFPYDQASYSTSISGISVEAVIRGIPQVATANTGTSQMLSKYGMPGVVYDDTKPIVDSVVLAIEDVLINYEEYALRAYRASELWASKNGPDKLVDFVLSLVSK